MPKVSKQSQPALYQYYECSRRCPIKAVSESDILSPRRSTDNHMSHQRRKVSFESCASSNSSSFSSSSDPSLLSARLKTIKSRTSQDEGNHNSEFCEIKKPRLSRSFCLQSLVDADDSSENSSSCNDHRQSHRRRLGDQSTSSEPLPISTDAPPLCSSWGHFVDVIPNDNDESDSSNPYHRKNTSRSLSRYSPYNTYWLSSPKKANLSKSTKKTDDSMSAIMRKIRI